MVSDSGFLLPASEEQFWRAVMRRWAELDGPGLLLVLLPADLNTAGLGRLLADQACHTYLDETGRTVFPLDRDRVYYYSPAVGGDPEVKSAQGLLAQTFSDLGTEIEDYACRAAQGRPDGDIEFPRPFHLLVTEVALPPGELLYQWVETLTSQWPGHGSPASKTNHFHVCCLITAPYIPSTQFALPEGCALMQFPDSPSAELGPGLARALLQRWSNLTPAEVRYLQLALTDMSGGRRPHAELALQWLDRKSAGGRPPDDCLLIWDDVTDTLQRVRGQMAALGLNTATRLEHILSDTRKGLTPELSRQLWAQGLWLSDGNKLQSYTGLVPLARVAIMPFASAWPISYWPTSIASDVQRQCADIEHQLKRWLFCNKEACPESVTKALETAHRYDQRNNRTISRREFVNERLPSRERHTHLSDENAIAACSFSIACDLLLELMSLPQRTATSPFLRDLVRARDRAAHGKAFTMQAYIDVVAAVERVREAVDI